MKQKCIDTLVLRDYNNHLVLSIQRILLKTILESEMSGFSKG